LVTGIADDTDPEKIDEKVVFRKRILFLMNHQSIGWTTTWTASRRGLYNLSKMSLRSGDGFGLTRSVSDVNVDAHLFIVWPKIVPVDYTPFLRNVWQGGVGKSGYVEDPTVLRGLRDYLPSDPWKRIDWRMVARSDALMTRMFDTILPSTIHFVLDVTSFTGLSEDNNELEDSISVLASLVLELSATGIRCGLSLPGGLSFPPVDINPDDAAADASDILNSLAALEPDKAVGGFDEGFIESISQTVGQLWLVVFSGKRLSCRDLADKLEPCRFFVLCQDKTDPGYLAGRPALAVDSIKKEETV